MFIFISIFIYIYTFIYIYIYMSICCGLHSLTSCGQRWKKSNGKSENKNLWSRLFSRAISRGWANISFYFTTIRNTDHSQWSSNMRGQAYSLIVASLYIKGHCSSKLKKLGMSHLHNKLFYGAKDSQNDPWQILRLWSNLCKMSFQRMWTSI